MVNPSGIQLDMINTIAGNEDTSPDWIWDSAGRVNDTRLRRRDPAAAADHPLQGRRGRADGHPVLAPRQPHRRVGGLAGARAGQVGVREAREARRSRTSQPRPTRELIPSATYSRAQDRDDAVELGSADDDRRSRPEREVGPHLRRSRSTRRSIPTSARSRATPSRWRSTSASRSSSPRSARSSWKAPACSTSPATARATRRCSTPSHTRNIVDPIFGAKLTGSAGRVTFGTLTAVDQAPGRTDDPLDPLTGKEKLFQIARAQISLKPGSYAGAHGDVHRPGRPHQCRRRRRSQPEVQGLAPGDAGSCLGSTTDDPEKTTGPRASALQANYSFNSRRVNLSDAVRALRPASS